MLFGGRKMKHKKQKKTKKAGRILLAVFAVVIGTLGVLLFTSERWMRKTWPNLSMEELVYQLKAPIAGTSHDLLMSYVCSSALIAAAALILLILVSIFLREKRKAHVAFGMICIAAGAASIVYSINDVWAALDVKDYLKNQSTYNTVVEDNYVDPDRVNITFPEQKRNLIYLYLESMESTYADKASGGAFDKNYIPELTQLAADNISFSNTELLGGGQPTVNATWTLPEFSHRPPVCLSASESSEMRWHIRPASSRKSIPWVMSWRMKATSSISSSVQSDSSAAGKSTLKSTVTTK